MTSNDAVFNIVKSRIANFYISVMGGQVRKDSPTTLMKYSRDWEYTWAFIKADVSPKDITLDCGAGNSPLPFLFSTYGAESYAIDKDAIICSKVVYIFKVIHMIISDLILFPKRTLRKLGKSQGVSGVAQKEVNKLLRLAKYLYSYFIVTNYYRISRIVKPDFWGPVSPKLLKKYKVVYSNSDMTSLPFPDEYFNTVICISVLEHLSQEDKTKGIKEMSRVVRPNGKLIITYDVDPTPIGLEIPSSMEIKETVYFKKPDNLYDKNNPDIIGMYLVKKNE